MSRTFAVFTIAALATVALGAQPVPAPALAPATVAQTPPVAPTPPTPPAQAPVVAPVALHPEPPGKSVNVQVEVTISDQMGSEAPEKKVVSLVVADGAFGRVRANGATLIQGNHVPLDLNVDARPRLLAGDAIRLELTLQYVPISPGKPEPGPRPTNLNQSLTVILQNGKPMTVSRAADPASNRRITVDVTAIVLK